MRRTAQSGPPNGLERSRPGVGEGKKGEEAAGPSVGEKERAAEWAEAGKNRKEGKGGDAGPGRLLGWAE